MISGVAWPSLFDSHFKTLFLFFNFRSTRAITGTSIVLFTKAFSKECGSYKFPTGPGVVVKGNAENWCNILGITLETRVRRSLKSCKRQPKKLRYSTRTLKQLFLSYNQFSQTLHQVGAAVSRTNI